MPHATQLENVSHPEAEIKEELFVNDGPLDPSRVALLRPSSPSEPMEELRRRYNEDGYVFLKHLLPREDVLKARERYFTFLSPSGILKENTAPVDGLFDLNTDPSTFPGIGAGAAGMNGHPGEHAAVFVDLALKAHTEDWYAEEFCKHPVLRDFIARFTDWGNDTLGVKRSLLRNNVPGTKAIGVHYDQIFLRYGEPTSVTAWVPIGDVNINGGGLIYLERGHTLGRELEEEFTQRAVATGLTEEEARSAFNQNMMTTGLLSDGPADFSERYRRRWLVSAFDAGDVVLHNPFAVCGNCLRNCESALLTASRFTPQQRIMIRLVGYAWLPICASSTHPSHGIRFVHLTTSMGLSSLLTA
jgi:phytanoyl-CoA hydroxylase